MTAQGDASDTFPGTHSVPNDGCQSPCDDCGEHDELTCARHRVTEETTARLYTSLAPSPSDRTAEVPQPVPLSV